MTMLAMSDITQILSPIESGDQTGTEQVLPLDYDERQKLAAAKLVHKKTDATAPAHDGRGHFFAAAWD